MADILREVQTLVQDDEQGDLQRPDFISSIQSCNVLLIELHGHLEKYKSLNTQQRKALDRIKWDKGEVTRLHGRITHSIQVLSMSLQRYNASSQTRIVRLLREILAQVASGQREASSVASFVATDVTDEDEVWPDIVKDLDDRGLEEDTANEHRELIIGMLREARVEGLQSTSEPMDDKPVDTWIYEEEKEEDEDQCVTTEASSTKIFSSGTGSSQGQRESVTSVDACSVGIPDFGRLSIGLARKCLAIFDPEASDLEAQVKKQPNTLREDINLAKKYWASGDWENCKSRLLRLLVASSLPRHRRSDLSPRLLTFLLGVACTHSGNLETARLTFKCLLTEGFSDGSSCTSPSSPSREGLIHANYKLDDASIAAATWLGDLCLMTDRGPDAVFAYALALEGLQRKPTDDGLQYGRQAFISPDCSGVPEVQALNRSALEAHRKRGEKPKCLHQQLLACELDIANRQNEFTDELLEYLYADDYPHATSAFEDANLPLSPISVVQKVLPPPGSLSHGAYPLLKEYKKHSHSMASSLSTKACSRDQIIAVLPEKSVSTNDALVAVEERLTIRPSRAGWPLMWNPNFSLQAALYTLEYYHNSTPLPAEHLLSDIDALAHSTAKTCEPDYSTRKSDAEGLLHALHHWLKLARIESKEFPTEIRCRPRPDHSNRWPEVAVFAISVSLIKADGMFKKSRLAVCITDIMHWDGSVQNRAVGSSSSATTNLLKSLKDCLKAGEVETKAQAKGQSESAIRMCMCHC